MALNKMFLRLALALAVAFLAACSPAPAAANPFVVTQTVSCVSEDYTGTKLLWCQKICESGLSGPTLDIWIHRWINRYRDLPYCLITE